MIETIKALELVARELEPGATAREANLAQVADHAEQFLQGLKTAPAFVDPEQSEQARRAALTAPLVEEGAPLGEVLSLLAEHVERPGINPASGRFLGYIPGGGLYHAALGDFLAAVSNRYSGFYFASPGAAQIENALVDWMGAEVGLPAQRGGTLTSGGSLANLTSIVTARDACGIEGAEIERSVVYLTAQTHHSVDKALRIAGLGRCMVRRVPVDGCYRLNAATLAEMVAADEQAGLRPWLVVASAGSTNAGAIDPLPDIADIARTHDLWFHVDGAYGAFFTLCEEGKVRLAGMERADSLVMDPHKTLFLPYGTGAVLVRDRDLLFASHYHTADYMQDGPEEMALSSPADYSPELTRHFRGLRLWLPLKVLGLAPFRAALQEKMLLARYFHEQLQAVQGFEVGPAPDLSVVVYRYRPQRGDADVFNARLATALQEDGQIFVSSTVLDGHFVLRAAIVNFRTHLDEVETALALLEKTARRLAADA